MLPASSVRQGSRPAWVWVHKWLGLVFGLNLAFIGLTGSVIVFYREIDVGLNPGLHRSTPTDAPLSADQVLRIARLNAPHPITYLMPPDAVEPAWTALGVVNGHFWTTMIDSGTGAVLGSRDLEQTLAFSIYRLHSNLMLRDWWGDEFVGIMGLVLLVSAGSGLYVWWPTRAFWHALTTLRRQPRQILYLDLHNLVGAWASIALLVIASSGVAVVFPGLLRPLVTLVSTIRPDEVTPRPPRAEPGLITADQAMAAAIARLPGGVATVIGIPNEPTNLWAISLRGPTSDPAVRSLGEVLVDPWTGTVIEDRSPAGATSGERFMTIQLWIHNGALLGTIGRLGVCLAGLMLPALFTTALLLWLRKRRARRKLAERRIALNVEMSKTAVRKS